jgi:hypothetical protein
MRPGRADLHLWTVTSWLSRDEPHGHEFSIWVSPLFLQTAARADYDPEKCQELARELLRGAGRDVADYHRCLSFGKWGLVAIELFGNGKCFYLNQKSDEVLLRSGGEWSSHNIDHAPDQSLLMAIWISWASYIETEVDE